MSKSKSKKQNQVAAKNSSEAKVISDPKNIEVLGPAPQNSGNIQITSEQYIGAIPHPKIIDGYEKIVPGSADRILRVFEEDSAHIRNIQTAALEAQKGDNKRLHWMAWSLVICGFVLSYLFSRLGKDFLASAILVTTIGAIIGGFIEKRFPVKKPTKNENNEPDGK